MHGERRYVSHTKKKHPQQKPLLLDKESDECGGGVQWWCVCIGGGVRAYKSHEC